MDVFCLICTVHRLQTSMAQTKSLMPVSNTSVSAIVVLCIQQGYELFYIGVTILQRTGYIISIAGVNLLKAI